MFKYSCSDPCISYKCIGISYYYFAFILSIYLTLSCYKRKCMTTDFFNMFLVRVSMYKYLSHCINDDLSDDDDDMTRQRNKVYAQGMH